MSIRDVAIRIGSQAGSGAGFSWASSALSKLQQSVTLVHDGIGLITGAAGMLQNTASATWGIVKSSLDAGDALDEMSARTGASVEFLDALGNASKMSGSDLSEMEKVIRSMTKAQGEVFAEKNKPKGLNDQIKAMLGMEKTESGGSFEETFKALNVEVADANGNLKSSETMFMEVISAISGMTDHTKKAYYAMEIFGSKLGTKVLPMLTDGRRGFIALLEESRNLGGEWTTETARAAGQMNDQLARIDRATNALKNTFALELTPTLNEGAEAMLTWFKANKPEIMNSTKQGARELAEYFKEGASALKDFVIDDLGIKSVEDFKRSTSDILADIKDIIALGKEIGWWATAPGRAAEAVYEKLEEAGGFGIGGRVGAAEGMPTSSDISRFGANQMIAQQNRADRFKIQQREKVIENMTAELSAMDQEMDAAYQAGYVQAVKSATDRMFILADAMNYNAVAGGY